METTLPTILSMSSAAVGMWVAARPRILEPERPKRSAPDSPETLLRAVGRTATPTDRIYLELRAIDTAALVQHLQSSRRAVLSLYLRQIRTDFLESSKLVRQFAADTDAPDLALLALKQSVRFHSLWLLLRLSLACRLVRPAWSLTERLIAGSSLGDYAPQPEHGQTASS